ncbi:MAG: YitT family protein [Bacteroidales bacterium]|nr:YitT family protein [Bacteroidales bacterium]
MKTNKILATLWDYFLMTVGSLIFCMAWTSFLIPNGMASGGLTGFCTIIQYGTGLPVGISYPVLNFLLLLLGFLVLGKGFGVKTIYVIILTSVLFDALPMFPQLEVLMDEKLLVALVGATMESVGIGLVLLRGGSTGGTDIIAMIINKFWPVSPGRVYLVTDLFIILSIFLVPDKGIVDVIYAYVVMLGFSFGVDLVLLGNKSTVQILVFSSKYQQIADHMISTVGRGVTALQSMGWYSKKESKVLMIVARKHQMNAILNEIKDIDSRAFISVSSAMSVFGEGFEEVKAGVKLKKNINKIEGVEQNGN